MNTVEKRKRGESMSEEEKKAKKMSRLALYLSIAALVISIISLIVRIATLMLQMQLLR